MPLRPLTWLLLIFSIYTPLLLESSPEKLYHIKKYTENVKIDGNLNETVWQKALKTTLEIEISPNENIPALVRTECLLFYDDKNLYVAFRAFDPKPEQIRAHLSDRDQSLQDDQVVVILDTFNDNNRAFAFFSNPLGIQLDEIMSDGGQEEDASWDAIWKSAGRITKEGYQVEMQIPFRALQFQRTTGKQTWGFSLLRLYPRSKKHQFANFRLNRNARCLLCQFSKIEGFESASPGRNIELDPTITAYRTDERESFLQSPLEKADSKIDYGISGRWGVSSNLSLSAAVNPDFSQVEADDVQLDINTQFQLYYPEKRPFFLEGNDFFQTPIEAFYTRSLWDPSWGIKISGKIDHNALGAFVSRDEVTNLLFPGSQSSQTATLDQGSTASVFRYRRDIGKSSNIGFLLTDREGTDYYNRLIGFDGLIRLSKSDRIRFQLLGTSTHYPETLDPKYGQKTDTLTGSALNFSYFREAAAYGWKAEYSDFSPDFRADLGFIPQVNYRKAVLGAHYNYWGKEGSFFSRAGIFGELDRLYDYDGNILEEEVEISINCQMPLQTSLSVNSGLRNKIYNAVPFKQGFLTALLKFRPSGVFYFECSTIIRDDIDFQHTRAGNYFQIQPGMEFHFNRHLFSGLYYAYSHLDISGGRLYRAHLIQGHLVYHFNKRAFLRGIVQYIDVTQNPQLYNSPNLSPNVTWVFSQFLFSYKLNPRTVLFLGYSDNHYGLTDIPVKQQDRTFFLKIGYALSL